MALFKAKSKEPINYTNPIAAKIQQRRLQILIHSYIYYELDLSIVSDSQWNNWAQELKKLQETNPKISNQVIYNDIFSDFDPSTGFNLTYDEFIKRKAHYLIEMEDMRNESI